MKRVAFAVGILALGFTATTPARADYAVVKFADGFCQIWWDAGAVPFGTNWAKVAVASDWPGAMAALYAAIQSRTCN
jgi:hypothetical protein